MEQQVEYGERRVICPLYKAAAIMAPGRLGMSVACDGRNCGMWAMCQGTKIYNPVPVKMVKDPVPGL